MQRNMQQKSVKNLPGTGMEKRAIASRFRGDRLTGRSQATVFIGL